MKFRKHVFTSVWLAGLAAIFTGCSTSEHLHHHDSNQIMQPANEHHDPGTHAEVAVPEKTADIFRETEKHFQELAAAIQSKDARMAHQHDSAIRSLIANIPQRATAETKADADALAHDITDAASAAHHSAHEDQWVEAADYVKHGQASLAKLKASFKESPR